MKVKVEVATNLVGHIANDPSKVKYIVSTDSLEHKAN